MTAASGVDATRPAGTPGTSRAELLGALATFREEFAIAGLLSALVNLLMLTPTLYMLQIYDRVVVSQNELTLVAVSLITLALFALMALAEWSRSRLLVRTGIRLDERLSSRVFDAAFASRLAFVNDPGRPPAKAFADLITLRQFLTGAGLFAILDLPWTPIYIGVMFLMHPTLGALSVAFALVQAALAWFGHRRLVEPAEAAQAAQNEAQNYAQGKLRNAEAIESMGMIDHLRRQWLQRHRQGLDRASRSASLGYRITALSKFVRYTQQSLSLGAGALLVIQGELSPGSMIAANVLMSRALAPLDQLIGAWAGVMAAARSFGRLGSLLREHPGRPAAPLHDRPAGDVVLRGVTARAPGRPEPILQDVDLTVAQGTVLVVLGPSGSGKSTLLRVLLGIWGDTGGEVTLAGRPIESWARGALGPHLGYLPQDIELFDGSIAENIARFAEVDAGQVVAAAKATGLHEMILRLPRGYDTPIGEAGMLISAGQRQRIALARAVYGEPALVVLDEPNANLDDAGEAALARTVAQLRAAAGTVILVTHRPAAIALADQLLILERGRIAFHGTREQLIALQRERAAQPAALPAR